MADHLLYISARDKVGTDPREKREEHLNNLRVTVKRTVERMSERLFSELGWSFRLREDKEDYSSYSVYVLLLVDERQAIIERLAEITVKRASDRIEVRPSSHPDAYYVSEGDFEDQLTDDLIGEDGVMKELLRWRMKRIQNRK